MDIKEFKQKAKAKYVETKTRIHVWYVNNEAEIWAKGMIVLPVVGTVATYAYKAVKAHTDEHHLKMQQYDPATGLYNQLKHPLTSQETARLMEMKRETGLTYTECLLRLNLIK